MSKLKAVEALPGSRPMPTLPLQALSLHLQQVDERLAQMPSALTLASLQKSLDELNEVMRVQRATLTDLASELGRGLWSAIDERLERLGQTHQLPKEQVASSTTSLSQLDEATRRLTMIASAMNARTSRMEPLITELREAREREQGPRESWLSNTRVRLACYLLMLAGLAGIVGTAMTARQEESENDVAVRQRQAQMAKAYELLLSRATPKEREAILAIAARPGK